MDEAHHDHHGNHDDEEWRETSPMQDFTMGQVGTGLVVMLVGLALVFGVPLLLG